MGLDITKLKVSKEELYKYLKIRSQIPNYGEGEPYFEKTDFLFFSSTDILTHLGLIGEIEEFYEEDNNFVIKFTRDTLTIKPKKNENFTFVHMKFDRYIEYDVDLLDVMVLLKLAKITDEHLYNSLYSYELKLNYKSVDWSYKILESEINIEGFNLKKKGKVYNLNGKEYLNINEILHLIKDGTDFNSYILYTVMYFMGYRTARSTISYKR